MKREEILAWLQAMGTPAAVAGMARFGITSTTVFGVSIPQLRALAKETGRHHPLALELWAGGSREERILAAMIAEPGEITRPLLEGWVGELDNWEVCDQCCMNLFEKSPLAWPMATAWSEREEEFVRRAGFVLMARLAVSDKQAADERFEAFFPWIEAGADDPRNYVKKAVSWALRQIGKRNLRLHPHALAAAGRIAARPSKSARWVASDVLRELGSEAVLRRLAQTAPTASASRASAPRVSR